MDLNSPKPLAVRSFPSPAAITALADILANFSDWPSSDLISEVREIILSTFPDQDPTWATFIAGEFLRLPTTETTLPNFNHERFVAEKIGSFEA